MTRVLLLRIIPYLILLSTSAWGHRHNVTEKHSVVRRNTNTEYNTIINFWQDHKNKLVSQGNDEEVVLVMGNTGSGKSTLVSALVGRKLRAINQNGYRAIVDDEDRIGTGSSSKTLIPEAIFDGKNKVTYIDCAGFRDNRNVEYELSSIYFQNILMQRVKKVKFVFVINYESLKNTGNKNDFDDLFEHIGEFIKNISKFHDGIALVATKVENSYEQSDDGNFFLANDNQSVLKGIGNYLKEKRETYRSKTDNLEKYKMFVDLITALLQENNNAYTKIAIFRQPAGQGLLTKLKATNNEINAITKMVLENLHYVQKERGDFGFALSKASKNTVDRIVTDIFRDALTTRLYKIGNETLTHYAQIEMQYSDIEFLGMQVSRAFHAISRIKNANGPLELFQNFLNATNYLNISVSLTNLNIISQDIMGLKFFTTISDNNGDLYMMLLKTGTQHVIDSIENVKNFYDFLNNLQANLGSYSAQKLRDDKRIGNIMRSCINSKNKAVRNIVDLENIVKQVGISDEIYRKIKTLMLNQFQLKHLKSVFEAFLVDLEFSCTSPAKSLIIKGFNIRMSDVVKIECWSQAENIQIFALNKIFLDSTIDKTGRETQLFLIAPTWEVFGRQKIILDGKSAKHHKKTSAKSADSNKENGADGLPGLPGGSAGHFFGVGKKFINEEYLEIHANGGRGGPGQDGGNGANGIPGKSLPDSFFEKNQDFTEMEKYFKQHHYEYTDGTVYNAAGNYNSKTQIIFTRDVDVSGIPAKKPSNGGNGGVGGRGGHPGEILIHGLDGSVNVKTSNNPGSVGEEGQGGPGGEETSEARRVKFTSHSVYAFFGVVKYGFKTDIKWSDGALIPAGKNGKPGINNNDRKLAVQKYMTNLYPAINSFKDFLRINLFENCKATELRNLIDGIDSDNFIKKQYNTLAFVKEFEGLENQSLELKSKINLLPFYNSLLYRIEEFAITEENLQNKKVLNYMYTAALTKVFTLKKKRMGKTVVDLSRYLSTIESSVKEIHEGQHLEIIQNYRNEYENNLRDKIREANDFIENKIEPEIQRLWEESDQQINAIIDEINNKRDTIENAMISLEKNKAEISKLIHLRSALLPLKLAASTLSFCGPVGAAVGVAVTSSAAIAEGMFLKPGQGQTKIASIDPNLRLMYRVTEVLNNKPKQLAVKLTEVMAKLEKNQEDLSTSQNDKIQISQKIGDLKAQIDEVENRKANRISDIEKKDKDLKRIESKINEFTNSRKEILEKEKKLLGELKPEEKNAEKLKKEMKLEKSIRLINNVQSVLHSAEIVFNFIQKINNDQAMIQSINNQISEYNDQLKGLEKMEGQVYETIMPDLKEVEKTMNAIKDSVNGSSHAKLDLTKWTVRNSLRDVKSLLQKFTHKMSFELQSDLLRYMENIDEGFSILIDIYDRIDSYSDSVKQAEYMAHIVSAPMMNVRVTDSELSQALISLKLIIHSNILLEKYGIALHAFKQHYFPFAAHVLQQFQLPTGMQLNDIETLRSNIVDRIKDMNNHIDESEATLSEYSKLTHNKNVFNSNTTGSSPFYVWKHDTIKSEVQQLLSGSEILVKADISKGLNYNSVKFSDIGIGFKLKNESLQNSLNSVLKNFVITMTMVGNNYYRCGERYYFISFDDDITISYTLSQDETKNWINPNLVYSTIRDSHNFLSPYGLWSIRLRSVNKSISLNQLKIFKNESIDLELIGRGYYIEQDSDFNFNICNGYLDTFYDVENIVKELS